MECVKKLNVESERRHTRYIHTGEAELQHRSKGKNEEENKLAVRNVQILKIENPPSHENERDSLPTFSTVPFQLRYFYQWTRK